MQERAKRREIALRIGNFLMPPVILAQSDYLMTCPWGLAENYQSTHRFVTTELPFRLPKATLKMVWHEKNERDPFIAD